MKKKFYRLIMIILTVSVLILSFLLFSQQKQAHTITSSLIGNRIEAAKELVSEKYYYTNTYSDSSAKDLYGWNIPFTETTYIISYDGVVSAGIDLSNIKVDVTNKVITITLPDATITSHDIQKDSFKVLDQRTSIFNPIQISDYNSIQEKQKAQVEERLIHDEKFLEKAKQDAQTVIRDLLITDPIIQKEYTIEFK